MLIGGWMDGWTGCLFGVQDLRFCVRLMRAFCSIVEVLVCLFVCLVVYLSSVSLSV